MLIDPPQPVPLLVDAVGLLVAGYLVYRVAIRLTPRWNLTDRGRAAIRGVAAIVSVLLAKSLIWPALVWLWQVRAWPDWLSNLVSSPGFGIFVGATLATAGGMLVWWWQERHRKSSARRAFNTLVRWELLYNSPRDHPHNYDPPTARRITLNAIPWLLNSGVLDPQKDEDLIGELIFMLSVVQDFNEKARTFDGAWAAGEPQAKQQKLSNDLQGSNIDYYRAHHHVVSMIGRLGKPPPDEEEDVDALMRETPRKRALELLRKLGLVESQSTVWNRAHQAVRRERMRFYPEEYLDEIIEAGSEVD